MGKPLFLKATDNILNGYYNKLMGRLPGYSLYATPI